jgi:hypothetical protein
MPARTGHSLRRHSLTYQAREIGHDHRKREEQRPQLDVRGQALTGKAIYTFVTPCP